MVTKQIELESFIKLINSLRLEDLMSEKPRTKEQFIGMLLKVLKNYSRNKLG